MGFSGVGLAGRELGLGCSVPRLDALFLSAINQRSRNMRHVQTA